MITLQNITKIYKKKRIIDNLNLEHINLFVNSLKYYYSGFRLSKDKLINLNFL